MRKPSQPDRATMAAFERTLRDAARRRAQASRDPDLARILARIGERRASRFAALAGRLLDPEPAGRAPRSAPAGAHAAAPAGPPRTLLAVDEDSASVRRFQVGRPPGFTFEAGQYTKLGPPGAGTNSYSIASAPHDPHLEFCIELVPEGDLTPTLFALQPGQAMSLADRAKGSFTLDRSARRHLMIATVTGIAPFRSMLRDAIHRGSTADFLVLHGASYGDELPYHDELMAMAETHDNILYVPTVSRPGEPQNHGWTGATGRVDALATRVAAERSALSPSDTHVYACGNPDMVSHMRSHFEGLGFGVSTEKFS